jgi:hypothetical protein
MPVSPVARHVLTRPRWWPFFGRREIVPAEWAGGGSSMQLLVTILTASAAVAVVVGMLVAFLVTWTGSRGRRIP